MAKLTNDELRQIIDYLRWYLPSFQENSAVTYPGLSKDAHRRAHPIMLALRRESKKVPLDMEEVRRLFANLYEVVGDYLTANFKRERRLSKRFMRLRARRPVVI